MINELPLAALGALTLFYYRLCSPNADSVIELPVFGQLCLKVQNGYKVFDLRRQVVVKVFSQEINPAIVRYEIEQVRRVGTHRFAPSVRRWNVEERWYEEDYVNGYTTSQESLVPLIADMMLVVPPREVGALAYAHNLGAAVWSERGKLSDRQLDTAHANKIRGFVRAVIDQLESAGERQIYLVFSHGDFSPRHVLTTGHSSVAVDWEAVGSRSALFDLFDAYFQRCFHGLFVLFIAAGITETDFVQRQSYRFTLLFKQLLADTVHRNSSECAVDCSQE